MVRKTQKTDRMRLIEAMDAQKRPIEQIIEEAYRTHHSYREAGRAIGITHAAFGQWVYRLGINLLRSPNA